MAEVNGKMIICDRCGTSAFLKCTGEGERDGGYTRWNKFEPAPEGWGWHSETGRLCPCCNLEYTKLIEKEVEITEETDLDILGRPGPVRVVQPAQEFTALITLTGEASEALRNLTATVEAAWRVIKQVVETVKKVVDNYPNRRVVHLATHGSPRIRKKNAKRIARYYKKHKER